MARKPRKYCLIEDGYYHVLNRGNNKSDIFRQKSDYYQWKKYLKKYKEKYGFKVLAYVLMPNHYHLLIRTGDNLPKIVGNLNRSYAVCFNRKYNLSGHLFQGRYKSHIVANDPYLVSLVKYIHNNPVRSDIVPLAKDYPYSSIVDYQCGNGLTDIGEIESLFNVGTPLSQILW